MGDSRIKIDWILCLVCLSLLAVGLLIIKSVAPDQFIYQGVYALVAIVVFTLFTLLDFKILVALNIPIYIASMIFLVTPMIFGLVTRGAMRWLQFGQISIQPSELVKPFFVLTLAFISSGQINRRLLWSAAVFFLPGLLIFLQPDLGTTLVYMVCFLIITAFNLPKKWMLLIMIGLITIAPFSWFLMRDYQKNRIKSFFNPYSDPLNRGYHVIQSVISIGSGRIFGKGLGQGSQSQLKFLPERQTDFIFASLTEELGLMGSTIVILLFALLLWRVYLTTGASRDLVEKIYCLGIGTMLIFQIFVNIGMNLGLVPVTGITLPLLSYGGSSLVSLGISLGMVHSISSHKSWYN